ncbi:Arm DNA-binding domain-containing protein [Arcobacter cryaerophilus gv. pseudocryaerophilus]|uniref:Arm DNA-binding domain-containing protein n=2 Tax=Arcobacteraceae TaxID=2808963 RepID=A0AAU0P6A3_9BACT|nr:Arm DNA-binding domain-containing protein [Arcobacter sp. AZ-2023]WPD04374.1 Arm DNA-binding domain-containing protein [Arcobacter sp. DSM 115972]
MKRSVKKLTELELKKAAVKEDKDYNLSDGDGLYFIVRRNGSKFFRLDFRLQKSETLEHSFQKYLNSVYTFI